MWHKLSRLGIVLAGIVLGQAILYGPSLIGSKILLPLETLALPDAYLPRTPETENFESVDHTRLDLAYYVEPSRRFAAAEFHAGRFPAWIPYEFCGSPFMWARFSPFLTLESLTPSPVALAWAQLLMAVVAGLGACLFFDRGLGVGFWPAAICAWCYPLTGFFTFWQGFDTGLAVYWLPWLLLAVDRTVRGLSPFAPLALGLATALTLVSGHLDVAAQVLLGSGLYALWCLVDVCREARSKPALTQSEQRMPNDIEAGSLRASSRNSAASVLNHGRVALGLVAGWTFGFLLAAPYFLPVLEYTRTGARIAWRSSGGEERPPIGLASLPEVVLPDMYGSFEKGSYPIYPQQQINLQESPAAAYVGVLATLFAAPLAFCSRRHRRINWFFVFLAGFGLSWCLNLPGLVHLLRLPGLNMMSHNRLVFLTAFALLALAAVGLEALSGEPIQWRRWLLLPSLLPFAFCGWCVYRNLFPADEIDKFMKKGLAHGGQFGWIHNLDDLQRLQSWFAQHYSASALLCGLAVVAWWLLWSRRSWQRRLVPVLGAVLVGDLLWFADGRSAQCDPALYFPPIPVLQQVANSSFGRIIGYDCLPAILPVFCGLHDIRGYDGVDPARMVELVRTAGEPNSTTPDYARTQWLIPKTTRTPDGGIRLPPVLDMLGVRYVIFRGTPPPEMHPAFQSPDYWVMVNPAALPRVFVPQRVELVTNDQERLEKLASPGFDPRQVAYVESPVSLPSSCQGQVEVREESPTRITATVHMKTPGLVVLADRWDGGWQAWLDGKSVPILQVNHAIRGVVVPAGAGTLKFSYQAASFTWGLRLFATAALAMLGWLGVASWRQRKAG
ncbi:MAG TPA: hypothetical protein VN578_02140 [Candidatus Binatia bacterium]|jgi:hypothetical protein|nr:hypothetical protein [Candidatus Binatia bacterium]